MPRLFMGCLLGLFVLAGCGMSSEPAAKPAASSDATADSPAKATPEPAAPSDGDTSGVAGESGGAVQLEKITLTAPDGWQRNQAGSQFVLAEFALPKAEGDDADGRLTVSVAGGSIEANVDRWKTQFGGKPEKESQQQIEAGGLQITVVDFTGEFNDQRGPFAPAAIRPAYRMLAAIIPVDGELHFIKATGPEKTIAANAEKFDAFVRSVQKR
jgi:hypothetical protein